MDLYKKLSDYDAPKPKLRVGGEIDEFCSRCHLTLGHTVLAMEAGDPVKVMCNTCKNQHKFKAGPASSSSSSAPRARKPSSRAATANSPGASAVRQAKDWQEAIIGKSLAGPIPYSPGQTYEVGQVILHGMFGIGVVSEVKQDRKLVVTFEDGKRILVHARP